MPSKDYLEVYFILFLIVGETAALSYNRPTFCPTVTWEKNAATYANVYLLGAYSYGLFIDNNNSIYTTNYYSSRVLVWNKGSQTPTRVIQTGLLLPVSIFVSNDGDIYVDNGYYYRRVDKWSTNSTSPVPVMHVSSSCYGLFVDTNNSLYCSMQYGHQVVRTFLNGNANNTVTTVAGNGTLGSTSTMLNGPTGIYVDTNFDLYVADTSNHRIQRFPSGQRNASTVAITGPIGTIILTYPSGVTMDGNDYLYIVDQYSSRIIGSGPNGYRCVIGCSGTVGWNAWQLRAPYQMAFDSYGNIFVIDRLNSRLQKFALNLSSCVSFNQPKLCSNSTWLPDAITFASQSVIDAASHSFFIDFNDKIYFPNHYRNEILVWSSGSLNPTFIPTGTLSTYTSVFVTPNGDMYYENGNETGQIDKWPRNATNSSFVTKFDGSCYGLFVDINDTLYCSMRELHLVVSIFLQSTSKMSTIVAGNGTAGLSDIQLDRPFGIFVDFNLDLYVADALNNRIQLFRHGYLNGTTVAGNGFPNTLMLYYPTDVILDADGYLFIADNDNNRIVRVSPIDFQCIAGCSETNGSAADELYKPYSLRFDSQGNIYVADEFNKRIQKFILAANSCVEFISVPIVAGACPDPSTLGINCNNSNTQCDMILPCRNNGTCNNVNTTLVGYTCSCPYGFNGTQCQYDYRPCKSDTCWHNSTCEELSNTTFVCHCQSGWTGTTCETMVNYCQNTTCLNHGVCRPLFLDYRCECLGSSFSGRHCEITTTKVAIYKATAKSFASVAIIAILTVVLSIVIMDVLKYGVGIDVTYQDLRTVRMRRFKQKLQTNLTRHQKHLASTSKTSAVKPIYIIRKISL